jgi:ATP-dependent helicase HrpA
VTRVTQTWEEALAHSPTGRVDPALAEVRWMIEELRVSLFAQLLGTPYPVSEKRVLRAIERAALR